MDSFVGFVVRLLTSCRSYLTMSTSFSSSALSKCWTRNDDRRAIRSDGWTCHLTSNSSLRRLKKQSSRKLSTKSVSDTRVVVLCYGHSLAEYVYSTRCARAKDSQSQGTMAVDVLWRPFKEISRFSCVCSRRSRCHSEGQSMVDVSARILSIHQEKSQ